ncbi:MAG: hypothetical protein ACPLZF_05050 [Nitrososphaeria archaeon]
MLLKFFERESSKDPEVLLFVQGKRKVSVFEREPSAMTIAYKDTFLKKTKWPDINYGEDIHVYEYFIKNGHARYVFVDDYAIQLKGNIILQILGRIVNYQQLFISGFTLAHVTYATRYSGFLFYVRAFIVHLTFLYFSVKKFFRKF